MWAILASWVALATVIPVFIGIGIGVLSMNPPEYLAAKVFFSIAFVILLVRLGWWLVYEYPADLLQSAIFAFIIFGIISSLWITSIKWINNKIHASTTGESLEKEKTTKPATQNAAPNFKITLLGLNCFVPTREPKLTGIALNLRIRNTGKESIATDWKLKIKTPEQTLMADPMKAPSTLTLKGSKAGTFILQESDFAFENKVANNPLKIGEPPVEGWLLFYIELPKDKIMLPDNIIELTAEDFLGITSSPGMKRIGDWIHR